MAISHRNLERLAGLKEFLQNTYLEKRTLDFHVSLLFKARQGKGEKLADLIHKVQTWNRSFVKSHCLILAKGRERAYWICPTSYANLLYSGTRLRSDSDVSAKS